MNSTTNGSFFSHVTINNVYFYCHMPKNKTKSLLFCHHHHLDHFWRLLVALVFQVYWGLVLWLFRILKKWCRSKVYHNSFLRWIVVFLLLSHLFIIMFAITIMFFFLFFRFCYRYSVDWYPFLCISCNMWSKLDVFRSSNVGSKT